MDPAMKPERWQKIEEIYNKVVKLEPEERAAFLEKACTSDESLREEIESLLAYESKADQFIESPVLEVADWGAGYRTTEPRVIEAHGSLAASLSRRGQDR
jgi:hypothetical protein